MSTVEMLLQEINKLPQNEVEELLKKMINSSPNKKRTERRLWSSASGLGKDLWKGIDAQEYVNELRSER